MIILMGARGFLASHTRRALGGSDCMLVASQKPVGIGPREQWLDAKAFAGHDGDCAIRQAEAIVYFPSLSLPGDSHRDIDIEIARNVEPVAAILRRLDALGSHARFVYLSSGGTVYGRTDSEAPIPEDHPLAPISLYGLGKVLTEESIRFAGRVSKRPFAILRIANPVGRFAHSTRQGLIPAALRAINSGMPLRVYGDGLIERDYLAAADVADAIVRATHAHAFPAAIWNVGSGKARSILDILKLVGAAVGQPVPFEFAAARAGDVPKIVLNCKKIEKEIGWKIQSNLMDVVKEMQIEYLDKNK